MLDFRDINDEYVTWMRSMHHPPRTTASFISRQIGVCADAPFNTCFPTIFTSSLVFFSISCAITDNNQPNWSKLLSVTQFSHLHVNVRTTNCLGKHPQPFNIIYCDGVKNMCVISGAPRLRLVGARLEATIFIPNFNTNTLKCTEIEFNVFAQDNWAGAHQIPVHPDCDNFAK